MFKGNRGLLCVFLSLSAVFLALHAEQEQPVANNKSNIYAELYKLFAGQLSQTGTTNSAIAGLAVAGSVPKPAEKPVVDINKSVAAKNIQLLCIYCDICAQEATIPTPEIPVSALEKLGIFPAGKVSMKNTVLEKLACGGTVFGTVARAALFMQLPSFDELEANQKITRYFAEHDDVRRKALRAIEKIRAAQNDFLWLFLLEEAKKDPFEACYWSLPKLNKSVPGLFIGDCITLFTTLKGITPPCAYQGAYLGIISGLSKILTSSNLVEFAGNIAQVPLATARGFGQGVAGEFVSLWPGTFSYDVTTTAKTITLRNNTSFPFTSLGDREAYLEADICPQSAQTDWTSALLIRSISPFSSEFNTYDLTTGECIKRGEQSFLKSKYRGQFGSGLLALGGLAAYEAINFINIKNTYARLQADLNAFKLAQARLMSIARLLEGLDELRTIAANANLKALEALANEFVEFEKLRRTDKNFASLCVQLKTNTFKGEPSAFSNRARILLAHRLLRNCKRNFLPVLHSAGKIEILVAAAEFYAKHQSAGKPVCLVNFVDEPQPRIVLENAWNILVDEKAAVGLSISLGKNGASQHAIFSGPNGTGKSTDENAIAHALFTSRLGIACASSATLTPFDIFAIHRNEQENIESGDSSFMAQKAHFDEICAQIAAITDKRMFIIMDEPLNGTVEEEAGRIIYDRCKDLLAGQKQAICILATHAKHPTDLEADTNGAFANYYVKVLELSEKEFVRTFELERGIPDWWFNDAERRHRFTEWLSRARLAAHAAAGAATIKVKQDTTEKHE